MSGTNMGVIHPKRALITGVGGQDASYLCDILLERGYEVHGLYRRSSVDNLWRIAHCRDKLTLHPGDVLEPSNVGRIIAEVQPHEIYHEADQDSVGWSHETPRMQIEITAGAVAGLLECVRRLAPTCRVFIPCSAHMFGDPATLDCEVPQSERTPFNPRSPYGIAKVGAFNLARLYRERYGLFVSTGILFNHDSPRRSDHYLLHKICKATVRIVAGKQDKVALGNLDARVDIGYAHDYMLAAWQMLQLDKPDEFVIGTGVAFSVAEMLEMAFKRLGQGSYLHGQVERDPEFWHETPKAWFQADRSKAYGAFCFCPSGAWNLICRLIDHFKREQGCE